MDKKGFTLAEVLITLGIIGVVAALTIPTLMQNYKKKIIETRLMRVYSVMNQAIKLSTIENGNTETWDTLGTFATSTATYEDILAWYNKYLVNYLKVLKVEKGVSFESNNKDVLLIYFHDGSVLSITNYIYDMSFYPNAKDVGKEKSGVNYFRFRFLPKYLPNMFDSNGELIRYHKYAKNPGFVPYAYCWDGTYDGAIYDSVLGQYGCAEDGSLCTKLIQLNNWKIPDDYPLKF